MLSIHILDVGHGDSIILEYDYNGEKHYGVIDSNIPDRCDTPPALTKLQALSADFLSFVALTHPHFDHYNGLLDILKHYEGRIRNFYGFPLGKENPVRLTKLKETYRKVYKSTDSNFLKKSSKEFVQILHQVYHSIGKHNWEEPTGVENSIYPEGFLGVDLKVLLPHPKEKGRYFEMIEKGDEGVTNSQDLNNLSLAFQVQYAGIEIILGGDGTNTGWKAHQLTLAKGGKKLNGDVVKLPHHGSKKECESRVMDYLFSNSQCEKSQCEKIACISANGRSHHPATEVMEFIGQQSIHPYCTNLSDVCKAKIKQLNFSENLDPELNRVINIFEEHFGSAIQPCQGDIEIKINQNGEVSIVTQYHHPCIYRGDYDFLSV